MQVELDKPDEVTAFIVEGTYRLATISMNEYGFLLSAKLAQSYLCRAMHVLELKRGFDRAFFSEASFLKSSAGSIASEYAPFEIFCTDSERFDHLETKNLIGWVSKCAVRAISRSYRVQASHHLAYKIRAFHSRLSSLLTDRQAL